MRWFLLFVCLLALLIFATDWHSLGIAAEPLDTSFAFVATVLQDLDFYAGPGIPFTKGGIVPKEAQVLVLGWICTGTQIDDTTLWLRAEYDSKRGWVLAYHCAERLLERDGKALFPIKILKTDPKRNEFSDQLLQAGETGDFLGISHDWVDSNHMYFLIRKGGDFDLIDLYNYKNEDTDENKTYKDKQKNLLEFPPGFWQLCLLDNHWQFPFEQINGKDNDKQKYYKGPASNYSSYMDYEDNLPGYIIFVEGKWALIHELGDWRWVYIGDETDPKVRIYTSIFEVKDPEPGNLVPNYEDDADYRIRLEKDIWPKTTHLYLEFIYPYFGNLFKDVKIEGLKVYQPLDVVKDLDGFKVEPVIKGGWHETFFRKFPIELPTRFDPNKPFRITFTANYGKYGSVPAEVTVGE